MVSVVVCKAAGQFPFVRYWRRMVTSVRAPREELLGARSPWGAVGAMAAAQLFAAAKAAQPEIPDRIAEGDFMPLVGWMRENLHAKGSSASTDELMEAATGKPLGADDFKAHLQARYG